MNLDLKDMGGKILAVSDSPFTAILAVKIVSISFQSLGWIKFCYNMKSLLNYLGGMMQKLKLENLDK